MELTVPWEIRCQKAHERKYAKYEDLLMEYSGWQTWYFQSKWEHVVFQQLMASLGMSRRTRKRTVSAMAVAAERASSSLWLRIWTPDRLG